ncbi:sulfotransferase family protein [Puniceibacterium confluentis]|uniref:sulfotransferase family protein n=1 Tax=Puniceibacterium confluentis TaxID=1958944 RepID=UPI0011B6BD3D|nr:sulfotransferase family protein [Puniceibacterium confluentis]
MTVRVINLGLPKSGTTTLGVALQRAGLAVADFKIRRGCAHAPDLAGSFVARHLYDGYFQNGDPLARLGSFQALSEISVLNGSLCLWPQADFGLITALRHRHPSLKFLASRRDARAVSSSMLRWSDLGTDRLPQGQIPGLPRGYGGTTLERITWIEAHHAFLRMVFEGDPAFLEYDTADPQAPAQIGAHLGLHLPWWGKANENTRTPEQTLPREHPA